MKADGIMKKTSGKLFPIYIAAAVLAAAVLRFFQYVSLIDYQTGFFIKGSETAGALIYIAFGAAAVIAVVLGIVCRKKGDAAFFVSSDGMGERATQPLGISFLAAAVGLMFEITAGELSLADKCFTVTTALIIAGIGFVLLKKVVPPKFIGYVHILLAVIWFIRSATFFMSDLIILHHSDNLIILLCSVLTSAFFLSSARFYSRAETKNSRMREIITASFLALISDAYVISKAAALLFGGSAVKGMDGISAPVISSAVLSTAFVFVLFFTEKKKEIDYLTEKTDKKGE